MFWQSALKCLAIYLESIAKTILIFVIQAEFKRHARIIAQDYFRQHELPSEYNKAQRNKVINFVDTHFNQINKRQDI